ncbi:MAG: hypothetical protein E7593_01630 [Ruminococcaceae bacterium]|nr:hypothetical protein [Oscillospiraceae bacterium]
MKKLVSIILVLVTMLGFVGCSKNNTNSNISSGVGSNTANSADELLENNTKLLNIDSLDKLNFYAVKKAISEYDTSTANADNNGGNVAVGLSNTTVKKIDPNAEFVITMYSYFSIMLNDENGFLAQKLGGTGNVEVVITKNNFNNMITFRKGEQYYSCFQIYSDKNEMSFSTYKYVSGFNLVENYDQENYEYTIFFEGDRVTGIECDVSDGDGSREYTVDDIKFNDEFSVVIYKKQSITAAQLESMFATDEELLDDVYHAWGPWKEWKKATMTEPGIKYRVCAECSAQDNRAIPAWKDARPTELNVIVYELRSDGYWVVGLVNWVNPILEIPRTYKGEKVVGIAENAFAENTKIEEAILPSSIRGYGESIFYNCTSLKKVTLPNGIKTISAGMFGFCSSLKEVNIPDTVRTIDQRAFMRCVSLEKINIPKSIKTIGWCAFKGCKSLNMGAVTINCKVYSEAFTDVTFDELTIRQQTIGEGFNECIINKLIIPEGVEAITYYAFENATIGEISFPTTLKTVESYSFKGTKVEKLVFNSAVDIKHGAFNDCEVKELVICSGSTIGENLFGGCYRLQTIYYTGTRAEWKLLLKKYAYNFPEDISVICADD